MPFQRAWRFALGRDDGGRDTVGPGHVAFDRQAGAAMSFDLARRRFQPILPAGCKRDPRPGQSENFGEMAADPARRAGDERPRAADVEARQRSPGHDTTSRARSRSWYFWILPVEVFGSGPNTTVRGALK